MKYPDQEAWKAEVARRLTSSRKQTFSGAPSAAAAMGKPVSNLTMWESNYRTPTGFTFFELGKAYKKHPAYLAGMIDDMVFLPNITNDEETIALQRSWIKSDIDSLKTAIMADRTMEPVISKDAILLIDTSQNRCGRGVYALCIDGDIMIRNITPENDSVLITDNVNRHNQTAADDEVQKWIIGKVVSWLNNA